MIQLLSDVDQPVELGGLRVGNAGNLARCEPNLPMSFGFAWRGMAFHGEIARTKERLVVRLAADVAIVPFSAENTSRRQQLLALLQSGADAAKLSLVLSPSNTLILLREIELSPDAALTADTLVTQTATAVLASAPFLDLMAEYGFVERKAT